ncbi:MAG: CARDB domain-containing protein [Sneathiella sp.]
MAETPKHRQQMKLNPIKKRGMAKDLKPNLWVDLRPVTSHPLGPVPGGPNSGYCGPGVNGVSDWVKIKIINQGNTASKKFDIKIIFDDADPADKMKQENYGTLGPGASGSSVGAQIPASAWKSGIARFTIIADPTKKVRESNENNNIVKSHCSEPAG